MNSIIEAQQELTANLKPAKTVKAIKDLPVFSRERMLVERFLHAFDELGEAIRVSDEEQINTERINQ